MEQDYAVSIEQGHLLMQADGRQWVLDTGSPASIGHGSVRVGGRSFPLVSDLMGLDAARLSSWVGVEVDGLIGTDVLNQFDVVIDVPAGLVRVGEGIKWAGGVSLPVAWTMGIPVVRCRVETRDYPLVLDTGAQLSYLHDGLFPGRREPEELAEDFYPGIGHFLTPVCRLELVIGSEASFLRFGTLPAQLDSVLGTTGAVGILGCELLRDRALGYYPFRSVHVTTGAQQKPAADGTKLDGREPGH